MGSGISIPEIPIIDTTMESKQNSSSIPFPTKGVKLSYINEFYTKCGGKDSIKELTTTEINIKHQKEITAKYQSSLCEYLSYLNHPAVGEATVFISHAWQYKFVDVMDALEYYFKDNLDVIIWFDLFSNNQHIATDLDFNWWSETFKSAIGNFKHTVMVLCPWNNPIPLTRAWCIWELYCTIITKSKFAIALNAQNHLEFLNDILKKGATDEINNMLATINTEKSDSFQPEDKKNIFDIVKKEVGFNIINAMIFEQLRDWVIETTELFMKNEQNEIKKLDIMNQLGVLYSIQGKYENAEPLFLECLEKRKEILGMDHPDTLESMNYLATLYKDEELYEKAEPLFIDCIEKRKRILGEKHHDTLVSMNNLAALYDNEGKYEVAESLYKNSLEILSSLGEESHRDALCIRNNLTSLYIDQGKEYDETVEDSCEDIFQRHKIALGESHPDTLSSMDNLARLYTSKGLFSKAELLYIECLDKRKELLGNDHPDTKKSVINLANIYKIQGKNDSFDCNGGTKVYIDKSFNVKPKEIKRRSAVLDYHILNRNNTSKSETEIAYTPQS